MSDPRILSDEQLAAIRDRCDKATPEEWSEWHPRKTATNENIMASIQDIPALLASHAALTEQLDIARRNSEQVQRLVHDLMEEQLQE